MEKSIIAVNLLTGWLALFAALVSGAVAGMFFHSDEWMGGYGSYRRRLARLGHIAFAGMGFLNLIFVASTAYLSMTNARLMVASLSFVIAAVTMPMCCFLAAWRKPLRHLFPIPVLATLMGIVAILSGWRLR